jgi:selenocysteine lyase/cysteine desulfurase
VTAELLPNQRDAFEMPDDIAYFNLASLAPQLKAVREAGEAALNRRAAPWFIKTTDWFTEVEALRGLFARIISAPDAEGVALVPTTSYGIGVAARNVLLRAGQRILVIAEEYPSGIYTWRRASRESGAEIVTVEREPGQSWADAVLAHLDERVAVVSVPNVHWTDGSLVDLDVVAPAARDVGAALVIDAAQSAGAMPLDLERVRPDFLVTVGYKWLLGPFGYGFMYVAEQHRDGRPLEENWIVREGAQDFGRLVDYTDAYQPGARRFDVGGRTSFMLAPMATAALTQIVDWGVERIAATLRPVTDRIAAEADKRGLETLPADQRGPHLIGIKVPEAALSTIGARLDAANCFTGVRGASVRVAPHLYTTDADIERLFRALDEAL